MKKKLALVGTCLCFIFMLVGAIKSDEGFLTVGTCFMASFWLADLIVIIKKP